MNSRDFIAGALATGAATVGKPGATEAVKDVYQVLRKQVIERFGPHADVEYALAQVERKPESPHLRAMLNDELKTAGAETDPKLLTAAQALVQALEEAGQLPASFHEAFQTGSGGLAQGRGAVAAGERGVAVGRDFHGTVYMGTPPQDEAQALAIYREMLVTTCRQLPLRGVDLGASDPTSEQKRLDLDQVYVGLDTTQVEVNGGKRGRR